jgi:heme-degrading monooxygenase HmoA
MYLNLVIMSPNAGHEDDVKQSMERYGSMARGLPGFKHVDTLRGANGDLFGLAIWESEAHAAAARPRLMEATAGDDFAWVADMQNHAVTVE